MKILFVSNLFPDATQPTRGIYNARLLAHLGQLCEVRVVAPRPALPLVPAATRRAREADRAWSPIFPPVWYLPKIGSRWNHRLMAHSLRPVFRKLRGEFPFDAVLASWVYPDGCAVARLAAEMNFPCAVIGQGSDVHQYLQHPARRQIIVRELAGVGGVITRSRELARLLEAAGVPGPQVSVIYNGVDNELFQPISTRPARKELGLMENAATILYVGNLLPIKNPALLLDAFAELKRRAPGRRLRLVVVGDGLLLEGLRLQAGVAEITDDVLFTGPKSPEQVARYLQAANVLCIPSRNEGVPNVMLEAFAAGVPVVATSVGGIPELLTEDFLGRLVEPGNPVALANALWDILERPTQPEAITRHARQFSWPQTAAKYLAVLQRITSR